MFYRGISARRNVTHFNAIFTIDSFKSYVLFKFDLFGKNIVGEISFSDKTFDKKGNIISFSIHCMCNYLVSILTLVEDLFLNF